ncbi:MAG: DUF4256 domain-containing protein [Variovorax sp.]|nr:MAG: DUF4256 domain-containing protein [Variovorax sp.]
MKPAQHQKLIDTLQLRFTENRARHPAAAWDHVLARLQRSAAKLDALNAMEQSGGEPDVVGAAGDEGAFMFFDCATESPQGRRSLCYDGEALRSRKENKPAGSAVELAVTMGISLLTEAQYHQLQTVGEFDLKTSSWLATPAELRQRGGALFGDRRYDRVFVYHNGVQSYYAARGFRGALKV